MLLNDMSTELQQAFLIHLQLERVECRTVSWKMRSLAFLGVAGGLLWLWARALS